MNGTTLINREFEQIKKADSKRTIKFSPETISNITRKTNSGDKKEPFKFIVRDFFSAITLENGKKIKVLYADYEERLKKVKAVEPKFEAPIFSEPQIQSETLPIEDSYIEETDVYQPALPTIDEVKMEEKPKEEIKSDFTINDRSNYATYNGGSTIIPEWKNKEEKEDNIYIPKPVNSPIVGSDPTTYFKNKAKEVDPNTNEGKVIAQVLKDLNVYETEIKNSRNRIEGFKNALADFSTKKLGYQNDMSIILKTIEELNRIDNSIKPNNAANENIDLLNNELQNIDQVKSNIEQIAERNKNNMETLDEETDKVKIQEHQEEQKLRMIVEKRNSDCEMFKNYVDKAKQIDAMEQEKAKLTALIEEKMHEINFPEEEIKQVNPTIEELKQVKEELSGITNIDEIMKEEQHGYGRAA